MSHTPQWRGELTKGLRGRILFEEPLAPHTSFRIGGPADVYAYPADLEDLQRVVRFSEEEDIPRFIIGRGSNILISDKGFRGIVIDLQDAWSFIRVENCTVTVGGGAGLTDLLENLRDHELSGLENLIGIPGTVGGALRMNAGAFGVEIFDRLLTIEVMEPTGEVVRLRKDQINYGYRRGITPGRRVLLSATLELQPGNRREMLERMKTILESRESKQPLDYPSAGSVFKRPKGYYGGQLIEEAGCKGLRVGDAMVSYKHAGFIINLGHATADDVRRLVELVQQHVYAKFGVLLEPEIEFVGFEQ